MRSPSSVSCAWGASKQAAGQLILELLDGPSQRWLRHVTLLGGLCEIQLADRSQEISDLMHLDGKAISGSLASRRLPSLLRPSEPQSLRYRTIFFAWPPVPKRQALVSRAVP